MPRARILLVDDHELFRQGLAGLIDGQPDLQVAGQAGDGLEALALACAERPDLIVMDIKMPICDGLEATRLIRAEWPAARIVMLTVHDDEEKLFEAIKAGASGYILKNVKSTAFLAGVRNALAGEAVLPPKLAVRLLDEFARLARQPAPAPAAVDDGDLTPREQEVLALIAEGATDREIAAQLFLSVHTVKSHVCNILTKLHVVNRRQAAKWALRRGSS
jgi:two-component system, NarL family, nitrate/nitrite response regulator NarL